MCGWRLQVKAVGRIVHPRIVRLCRFCLGVVHEWFHLGLGNKHAFAEHITFRFPCTDPQVDEAADDEGDEGNTSDYAAYDSSNRCTRASALAVGKAHLVRLARSGVCDIENTDRYLGETTTENPIFDLHVYGAHET